MMASRTMGSETLTGSSSISTIVRTGRVETGASRAASSSTSIVTLWRSGAGETGAGDS